MYSFSAKPLGGGYGWQMDCHVLVIGEHLDGTPSMVNAGSRVKHVKFLDKESTESADFSISEQEMKIYETEQDQQVGATEES